VSEESVEEPTEEKISEPEPLAVKITNQSKKDVKWDDSKDDIEYEDLGISEEDMDI